MWMIEDVERPGQDADLLTLDWEMLGRLVRVQAQDSLAALAEGRDDVATVQDTASQTGSELR